MPFSAAAKTTMLNCRMLVAANDASMRVHASGRALYIRQAA